MSLTAALGGDVQGRAALHNRLRANVTQQSQTHMPALLDTFSCLGPTLSKLTTPSPTIRTPNKTCAQTWPIVGLL